MGEIELEDQTVILLASVPILTADQRSNPRSKRAQMEPVRVSPAPVVLTTLLLRTVWMVLISPVDETNLISWSPLVMMVLTFVYLFPFLALPTFLLNHSNWFFSSTATPCSWSVLSTSSLSLSFIFSSETYLQAASVAALTAFLPLHSYTTKQPLSLRYFSNFTKFSPSSTTFASTTTMSLVFIPLSSYFLKYREQMFQKVRPLFTYMSDTPITASFLSSSTPRQVGAFSLSSLIQRSYMPYEFMWDRRSSLVLSPPNAVTKVVLTPNLLVTSAMFLPTPPQLVLHTPLQLWYNQNFPSTTFTSKSTADPPRTITFSLPFSFFSS